MMNDDPATRRPRTRAETPFTWHVSCGMSVYAALAGVRFDRIFGDLDAITEAYSVGHPRARELFGPDVRYGGPGWAGISYGHINCLGSELRFPPDSEVAHAPLYGSLAEGVEALERAVDVDWAGAGLMPVYLKLWEQLKQAFPDLHIPFGGFGYEGPITTAWEMRGHGFFLDLYDDPELCDRFLRLVTDGVVSYRAFLQSVNGQQAPAERVALYDDISGLIRPDLWPERVLPFQERFFRSSSGGRADVQRYAHIEGLVPAHLPYLDRLGLDTFDPSVSPRLRPRDLRDGCRAPFLWRLNAMQTRDLDPGQIRRFVFEAVADGASGLFCAIGRVMANAESAVKVQAFAAAAQDVERLLEKECPRGRLLDAL